jgi:hypothetical protein
MRTLLDACGDRVDHGEAGSMYMHVIHTTTLCLLERRKRIEPLFLFIFLWLCNLENFHAYIIQIINQFDKFRCIAINMYLHIYLDAYARVNKTVSNKTCIRRPITILHRSQCFFTKITVQQSTQIDDTFCLPASVEPKTASSLSTNAILWQALGWGRQDLTGIHRLLLLLRVRPLLEK